MLISDFIVHVVFDYSQFMWRYVSATCITVFYNATLIALCMIKHYLKIQKNAPT